MDVEKLHQTVMQRWIEVSGRQCPKCHRAAWRLTTYTRSAEDFQSFRDAYPDAYVATAQCDYCGWVVPIA